MATKAVKQPKGPTRQKASAAKPRRKVAAPKRPKAVAAIPPTANDQPAVAASVPPPSHESLPHRIGSAIKAVVDTLADAEQLHRRLDPDPSKDPAPE